MALILSMALLTWYEVPVQPGADPISGFDAFGAFAVADVILLVTAIAAIALPVVCMALERTDLPVITNVFVTLLGIVACIVLLVRIAFPPDLSEMESVLAFAATNTEVEADRAKGLFAGLIATLGITVGAWLAMRDDGTRRARRAATNR